MASRYAPRRPPAGFVPITPSKWRVLCELVEQEPDSRELRFAGEAIGWHAARLWYADPEGYRTVVGRFPDGYWPE